MIYRITDENSYYELIEKTKDVLCLFGDEKSLVWFERQYKEFLSGDFDIAVIHLTDELAVSLQVIRVPQFRFYHNGNECFSMVGKHKFAELQECVLKYIKKSTEPQKKPR